MTEQERVFVGGGEMGALMRSKDWSQTPLGPVERWPPALRTAIGLVLAAPSPMAIFWGAELRLLYNDSFVPFIRDKHPRSLGEAFSQILPEVRDALGPLFDRVMRTGTAVSLEKQLLPLDRQGFLEEIYFTFSYLPLRDEHGRVVGVLNLVSEATAQVLAERHFKIIRELSIRTAPALGVQGVFQQAQGVLAQSGADVPFALLYRVGEDSARLVLRSGLEAGGSLAPESLALGDVGAPWPLAEVRGSGQPRLVEGLGTGGGALHAGPWPEPVRRALLLPLALSPGGARDAVLVVGLSPRLPLDEGYRGFLQVLSRQVAADVVRVQALEQETLRAAKLAELDRAKTAFFSNVSHEFRTPLTLLLGPVEDALTDAREPAGPRQRERLELIHRGAARLLKLVNTVLDFTRLEAGRTQAAFQPTDLSRLTRELASHFESAAERARLTLHLDLPALPEPVWVDPEMWEKVVFNLLSNAMKYTPAGSLHVRLRAEPGRVRLDVRDTGVGIPRDELPRLFERFHRVEGVGGRSHEGTGIGLSLVRELVGLHGGGVEVASVLGEGSTFSVTLPRGSAHLPREQLRAERPEPAGAGHAAPFVQEIEGWLRTPTQEGAPATAPATVPAARILVVDDNADLRAYISGLLQGAFEVETAEDGLAALEALRTRPPQLILSDVMMPRLGGFGLLARVRADPRWRAIPLILLSARAGEEASVEGLEAGADDYLVKPFSGRELVARVHTHLEMARVRREVAAHEARAADLEREVRARDDFLSVISHELKTPLTAFRLQLELIERGLSAESRTHVRERFLSARRQVHRLAALVETLLDVSRLASGDVRWVHEEVDLAALATEGVARMREELSRAECTVRLEADLPVMGHWDRSRLEQVVQSLLSNAVKFGPGKPIEVRLVQESGRARLSVVDHGMGVRPEERERIWERFARGVSARNYGGLGVGLWMARRVVEAHGGSLEVADTPGGGATFTVDIAQGRSST